MVIPLGRMGDTTQLANVVVRGRERAGVAGAEQRDAARRARGPPAGKNEICVGKRLVGRFPNTGIGETMHFAGRPWTVTCHFAAAGSAFESEIWGENEQIMPAMRRDGFQSLAFRLADPASFDEAKRVLEADKRVTVDVYRESAFYAKQSELLGRILRILAIMITGDHGGGRDLRRGEHDVRRGGVARARDRRAADARVPAAEHPRELPGRNRR